MRYERIVFMQDDDADEALDIYNDEGVDAAIDYLAQWHNPGEHDTTERPGSGTSDTVVFGEGIRKGYILTVARGQLYIGLEFNTRYA